MQRLIVHNKIYIMHLENKVNFHFMLTFYLQSLITHDILCKPWDILNVLGVNI